MDAVIISALATAYVVFVLHKKAGPYGIFAKLRRWFAALPYPIGDNLSCSTCAALTIGALLFGLYHLAPALVAIIAVAGGVLVLHGLAGHWHASDDV